MAKKNPKNIERRAMVEQMRNEQARKERTRSLLILGACVLVVLALIGSAAFVAIKDSQDKSELANTALSKLGVSQSAAKCDPIKTTKTDGNESHIEAPTPIPYADAPPSFGNHRGVPLPFDRPFLTAGDRTGATGIEVATLVHNLEHGFVVAWYDETAAKDTTEMKNLRAIADKLQGSNQRFIAAPWLSSDGKAFPSGKHIALTRWTADASAPQDKTKQRGNWEYCGSASGDVIDSFVKKWPNEQSPEPGIPIR